MRIETLAVERGRLKAQLEVRKDLHAPKASGNEGAIKGRSAMTKDELEKSVTRCARICCCAPTAGRTSPR